MELVAGAAIAFVVAALTTPAGVSGAFLLVPIQISVLGVPLSQVAPTNLLFNIVSIPGALLRFRGRLSFDRSLVIPLIAGSLPGVVLGAMVRTHALTNPAGLLAVVAAVLGPIGLWLLLGTPRDEEEAVSKRVNSGLLVLLSLIAGVIGGMYGIGGGAMMAPVLVALGLGVIAVAPATLLVTLATSIVGLVAFVLASSAAENTEPDWLLGLALGVGGLLGSYLGARHQSALPERRLRQLLGALSVLLSIRYAGQAAF